MLKIYDGKSNIKFPLRERTANEMKSMECYSALFSGVAVVDEDESGIVSAFYTLAQLKEAYGIAEPDNEKALASIIEAKKAAEIAAVKEYEIREHAIETTQNAVGELGVMAATSFDSTAELGTLAATSMQSTAELGATVAALEARIAALEAAKA